VVSKDPNVPDHAPSAERRAAAGPASVDVLTGFAATPGVSGRMTVSVGVLAVSAGPPGIPPSVCVLGAHAASTARGTRSSATLGINASG
jgi:hypothetical protein